MPQFLSTETLIIELLLIASLVAIVIQRFRIPYTVALVVVGLLLTLQSRLKFELTPELILAFFVPPLVFEAAFHLNFRDLQRNLATILLLAVPGVILTSLIVGGILSLGMKMSFSMALVFGALIAATDPVAVVALFRTLGVPKRLAVLIEGESLFNDGIAIVIFNLMLAIALTGHFNPLDSLGNFLKVSIGGIVIGLVLGWLISLLIAHIDDYLIETTLTTVLAFGSYLVAEQMHVSGVLAVVAAGLVNGNLGQQGMSPTTRIVLFNFWEYVAFIANSLIFLLIGLQVNIPDLLGAWQFIFWAILSILVARLIVVYGMSWISKRVAETVPSNWQHVLYWGGLRGAICLALALSLPTNLGMDRTRLQAMAFGVVLFTLLLQSTTMKPLVRWLHIIMRSQAQLEYELKHARLVTLYSAASQLDRLHSDGLLSTHIWDRFKLYLNQNAASLGTAMRDLMLEDQALEAEELDTGWRELNRAQRSALLGLRRDGVISEEAFERLTAEVDAQMDEIPALPEEGKSATQFLEVTIQDDSKVAGNAITDLGLPREAVFVSIRRVDEIIIPRGDTILQAGDVVTTLCERQSITSVKKLLLSKNIGKNE